MFKICPGDYYDSYDISFQHFNDIIELFQLDRDSISIFDIYVK